MRKFFFKFFIFYFLLFNVFGDDLDRIKREIKNLKKRLYVVEKEKKTILKEIEALDLKILIAKKRIKKLTSEYKRIKSEVQKLEKEIEKLKEEKRRKQEDLKSVLKIHYIYGKISPLFLSFSGKDVEALLSNNYYLEILERKIFFAFLNYKNLLKELKLKEEEYKKQLSLKEEKLKELRASWTLFFNARNSKSLKLKNIIRERKRLFEMLKEKKEQLKKLNKMIEDEDKIEKTFPLNFREFTLYRRRISWPIRGKIIESYGIKWHPKYKIRLKSTGIEIKPKRGEEKVRAVFEGIVIYADYFSGYGNTVILEHKGGYYTIYAHLDDIFVDVGMAVKEREVLGIIGETGTFGEKTLFFGIRKGKTAVNPLKWLKRRR